MSRLMQLLAAVLLVANAAMAAPRQTYYLSPEGKDSNIGRSMSSPWRTFDKAFRMMKGGDELVLLDGNYSSKERVDVLGPSIDDRSRIPSGAGVNAVTVVRALNEGRVFIDGPLRFGTSSHKDQFIRIEGITFGPTTANRGHAFYNSSQITIKNCGFRNVRQGAGSVLTVGTNDGDWHNSNLLLEDVWIWGKERIGLLIFRADHIVVRRAVVRNDGCDSANYGCGNNSGNYMVGTTVYNSTYVSMQNVLVLDSIRGPAGYSGASDFSTAMHSHAAGDSEPDQFGRNEWLGSVSMNSEMDAFRPESDNVPSKYILNPVWTFRNIVAVNPRGLAFDADITGGCSSRCNALDVVLENGTFLRSADDEDDVVRVGPNLDASTATVLRNLVVLGRGRFAINSPFSSTHVNIYGRWKESTYNQARCTSGCYTANVIRDGSLKYPMRVEESQFLGKRGYAGQDIGANVVSRYGVDGSRWGDQGFNTLTQVPLWPWPNEERIKREMCEFSGVTRGFCSYPSISNYLWSLPASIVAGSTPEQPEASPRIARK